MQTPTNNARIVMPTLTVSQEVSQSCQVALHCKLEWHAHSALFTLPPLVSYSCQISQSPTPSQSVSQACQVTLYGKLKYLAHSVMLTVPL